MNNAYAPNVDSAANIHGYGSDPSMVRTRFRLGKGGRVVDVESVASRIKQVLAHSMVIK